MNKLRRWIFAVFIILFFFIALSSFFMAEFFWKPNTPAWLNYCLTVTGLTGLTGVILLYIYQCKLIYPASIPEGSRQHVNLFHNIFIQQTECL